MEVNNNPREVFSMFLIFAICALGVIASAGSINYFFHERWLFGIAGVVNLLNVYFCGKKLYELMFGDKKHKQ